MTKMTLFYFFDSGGRVLAELSLTLIDYVH